MIKAYHIYERPRFIRVVQYDLLKIHRNIIKKFKMGIQFTRNNTKISYYFSRNKILLLIRESFKLISEEKSTTWKLNRSGVIIQHHYLEPRKHWYIYISIDSGRYNWLLHVFCLLKFMKDVSGQYQYIAIELLFWN